MSRNRSDSELGQRPVLAIVSCGPQLEIALSGPSMTTVSTVRLGGLSPRSTLLLAAVDLVIEDAGFEPGHLGAIVVARGPGSFTGIRSGLATAAGLVAATGATLIAYNSLLAQAARCKDVSTIWAAQPGRRGEVYAQAHACDEGPVPRPLGEIEILKIADLGSRGPWIAAEALDLGSAVRATTVRSPAEALLDLASSGLASEPAEPLYVEGPPVHRDDEAG